MSIFLLSVHVIICVLIVAFVLVQKPDSDGLSSMGGGGGGGGFGSMFSARAQSNFLTKTTGILAAGLFITSLLLVVSSQRTSSNSIIEQIEKDESAGSKIIAPVVPDAVNDNAKPEDESKAVTPIVPVAEPESGKKASSSTKASGGE